MRQIEFRGYSLSKHQWMYGFLTSEAEINGEVVIRESIGQFTGLFDKHNRKIFENDYVIGMKGWCDGYLKKKYPKKIKVVCEIRFADGKFYSHLIGPTREHKEAYEEKSYRVIYYTLDSRREGLEVVGNTYQQTEREMVG